MTARHQVARAKVAKKPARVRAKALHAKKAKTTRPRKKKH
jgi:hypothetical protein